MMVLWVDDDDPEANGDRDMSHWGSSYTPPRPHVIVPKLALDTRDRLTIAEFLGVLFIVAGMCACFYIGILLTFWVGHLVGRT